MRFGFVAAELASDIFESLRLRLFASIIVSSHAESPMPNKFIFADEAGCFTFNREANVSRFFILCTVTMCDWPAAGLMDTEIRCFMEPEVADATTEVFAGV
ncbi:hypothetical protein [Methylovirgula sp. HY1]|uniref:hypothetical protein n=1 Tax=Methylovirgula sp. HY1 TaxID=2822761 RepID=UPI001C5ACB37|nr:hypothetical protein [Methylovirgula sp. HY1]QXX73963.1 hypothetical protein MHY1_00764 [Methylovirgula sp. HY1]